MGNCCVSYRIILPCCIKLDATHNQGKVLKIVKPDGKVLEFTKPILVKDLLVDFTNSVIIGSSQHHGSNPHLPLNFELKIGQVYHMINPSPKASPPLLAESEIKSCKSTKRVRIVLTKAELKLLLADQVSMEELIVKQLERSSLCSVVESSTAWKPALAAIPEE